MHSCAQIIHPQYPWMWSKSRCKIQTQLSNIWTIFLEFKTACKHNKPIMYCKLEYRREKKNFSDKNHLWKGKKKYLGVQHENNNIVFGLCNVLLTQINTSGVNHGPCERYLVVQQSFLLRLASISFHVSKWKGQQYHYFLLSFDDLRTLFIPTDSVKCILIQIWY